MSIYHQETQWIVEWAGVIIGVFRTFKEAQKFAFDFMAQNHIGVD